MTTTCHDCRLNLPDTAFTPKALKAAEPQCKICWRWAENTRSVRLGVARTRANRSMPWAGTMTMSPVEGRLRDALRQRESLRKVRIKRRHEHKHEEVT